MFIRSLAARAPRATRHRASTARAINLSVAGRRNPYQVDLVQIDASLTLPLSRERARLTCWLNKAIRDSFYPPTSPAGREPGIYTSAGWGLNLIKDRSTTADNSDARLIEFNLRPRVSQRRPPSRRNKEPKCKFRPRHRVYPKVRQAER